jgi:molybdopterin biosynthesis enzyme MoaB
MKTMDRTPRAILSRGVVGIRGTSLIINLPGSPKGVMENLAVVMEVLPHALSILTGQVKEHSDEG